MEKRVKELRPEDMVTPADLDEVLKIARELFRMPCAVAKVFAERFRETGEFVLPGDMFWLIHFGRAIDRHEEGCPCNRGTEEGRELHEQVLEAYHRAKEEQGIDSFDLGKRMFRFCLRSTMDRRQK